MKKNVLVLALVLYTGCNAMDQVGKLIKKNGKVYYKKTVIVDSNDNVRLNNRSQHSVRDVLFYRNIIDRMSNKTHETALRFLAKLCLGRTDKLATIRGKKGLYFFYDKSNNQIAQIVRTLLRYNLIKKYDTSCCVPYIVDDMVQSQFEFQGKNIRINEPVKSFEMLKENFDREWQKKLLATVKK